MCDDTIILEAGTIVKINGFPYELIEKVEALGPALADTESLESQGDPDSAYS